MEKLDTDKKDAQHRLRVLNKKLLDYFKRKQVRSIETLRDVAVEIKACFCYDTSAFEFLTESGTNRNNKRYLT